jgi:hypothetical protein
VATASWTVLEEAGSIFNLYHFDSLYGVHEVESSIKLQNHFIGHTLGINLEVLPKLCRKTTRKIFRKIIRERRRIWLDFFLRYLDPCCWTATVRYLPCSIHALCMNAVFPVRQPVEVLPLAIAPYCRPEWLATLASCTERMNP